MKEEPAVSVAQALMHMSNAGNTSSTALHASGMIMSGMINPVWAQMMPSDAVDVTNIASHVYYPNVYGMT